MKGIVISIMMFVGVGILFADRDIISDFTDTTGYWCFGIAFDTLGNVYLTGSTTGDKFLTISTERDSTPRWRSELSVGNNDEGRDIVVNDAGECYVVGRESFYNWILLKYSAVGETLWTATKNGYRAGHGVTLDNSDNIVVATESWYYGTDSIYTAKYDPSGIELWSNYNYDGRNLTVDANGNVFLINTVGTHPDHNIAVTKLKGSDGSYIKQWTYNYGDDKAKGVAYDPAGYIITAGLSQFYNGADPDDYFIITCKYDTTGTLIWDKQYTTGLGLWIECEGVTVDPGGNVFTVGYGPMSDSAFILWYTPSGDMKQVYTYHVLNPCWDINSDRWGNIGICGSQYEYHVVIYSSGYITYPDGGESFNVGDTVNITWTEFDLDPGDTYRLLLSLDGGTTYPDTIVQNITNTTFEWIIPDSIASNNCRTKVEHITSWGWIASWDASDNDFGIQSSSVDESKSAGISGADLSMKITPNPVTKGGEVAFTIPKTLYISFSVYDIGGRKTADVFEGVKDAGTHYIKLPELQTGVYFLHLDGIGIKKLEKFIVIE